MTSSLADHMMDCGRFIAEAKAALTSTKETREFESEYVSRLHSIERRVKDALSLATMDAIEVRNDFERRANAAREKGE